MTITILGSSSSGNGYVLENGSEALIIEAGIHLKEVKKALKFNLRKVVGCLITHQHNDHSKYLKSMVGLGIPTLALKEVWEAKGVWDSRSVEIKPNQGYKFGNFKVMPFPTHHDVPCVGYLIDHPDTGRILFLTDSYMCEYRFSALNHVLIECNYSDIELSKAINDNRTLLFQKERLMASHMELSTCKEFLKANDLSNVENIVLLHLSENNSSEQRFIKEIQGATGKCVYAAKPGLRIQMKKYL